MSDDSNGLLNFTFSYKIDSGKMYTIPVGFQGNEPCFAKKTQRNHIFDSCVNPALPSGRKLSKEASTGSFRLRLQTYYIQEKMNWVTHRIHPKNHRNLLIFSCA